MTRVRYFSTIFLVIMAVVASAFGLTSKLRNGSRTNPQVSEVTNRLDDELVSYLDHSTPLPVKQMNKELKTSLHTTETPETLGWSAEITVYGAATGQVYLATYEDYFWAGTLISTVRVLQRVDDHWQVVGRMEDTPIATTTQSEHRTALRQALKDQKAFARKDQQPDVSWQNAQAAAAQPLQMNNVSINSRSIQLLDSGGVQFVSLHSPRSAVGEPTVIEWLWTTTRGLGAVSWIWGDQWKYDKEAKASVAKWQSLDATKNGKTAKQEDFLPD
jgi:hypothetical protein